MAILGAAMPDRYKYLAIIGFIAAALLGSQLLFKFYEWNKLQNCATAGGRNCGGRPIPLDR
jgi:hypothetical protein